jgi:gliding motility-associated-like protein
LTNAVGCDSVASLELKVNDVSTSITNINTCSNQLPFKWNGNSYSTSGTYKVTLANAAGCDSIASLNLVVNTTSNSKTKVSVCSNQLPYKWNGNDYSTSGTFNVTLINASGCDSIASLELIINAISSSITKVSVCANQLPYKWNGNDYSTSGTFNVTLINASGCDSIASLELIVNALSSSTTDVSVCANQLPYKWNGNNYSASGTFNVTLTNAAGCDSVATLFLTVNSTSNSTSLMSTCSNQLPFLWNENSYSAAGTYKVTLTNAAGCDSVATLVLTVNSTSNSTTQINVCSNQLPFVWNGNSYSAAGTYNVILTNASGCDSIATLLLIVNSISNSITKVKVCANQLPYVWNGNNYLSTGKYNVTLTNATGCDSVASLELNVNATSKSTTNVSVCVNQLPFIWNGKRYSNGGICIDTLVNALGCDSVATLILSVNKTSSSTSKVSLCSNQLPFIWNGKRFTAAGMYSVTLTNAYGCDSVAGLILKVNATSGSAAIVNLCPDQLPYVWNGNSYTSSGTYNVILTNALGCDSIATLKLMVNAISTSNTIKSICIDELPYLWNGNSYSKPGKYIVTLKNSIGCDSVATLTLTVNQNPDKPFLGNDTSICPGDKIILFAGTYNNYLWQDNSVGSSFIASAAGNYSVLVSDANGCTNTGSVTIRMLNDCGDIYFPNAFTPNGDGVNDYFRPVPLENLFLIKNYTMQVFDRYGKLVFITNDPNQKWDGMYLGKPIGMSTFAWRASYLYKGKSNKVQKGYVVLLR